jgi:MarR family transcriptional regulator, organic hydroperoxide resistance regulator
MPKRTPRTSRARDAGREAWTLFVELLHEAKAVHRAILTEYQLTLPQAQLLQTVTPDRPVPMNELAGVLYCDASNVTGLVDKLESRGLLARRAHDTDRRVKFIALTPAGTELRKEIRERMSRPPPFIASLVEQDRKALRDVLRKVRVNAQRRE